MLRRSKVRGWERVVILVVAITPVVVLTRGQPRFSWITGISVGIAAVAAGVFTAWLDARRQARAAGRPRS